MKFSILANAIHAQFGKLSLSNNLFVVDVDKEELWNLYLDSFPPGTNEIYKERREHDCNCCKNFIRDVGNVVSIKNGEVISIWDIEVGGEFQVVVDAMSDFIHAAFVKEHFSCLTAKPGAKSTLSPAETGNVTTWNHFYTIVPDKYVGVSRAVIGKKRENKQVFARGMKELTMEAVDTCLELMSAGQLYRGEEFKAAVIAFRKLKVAYEGDPSEIHLWENSTKRHAQLRNTSIGTLLIDLSDDTVDLETAVSKWESIMAPHNYKRPTSLITESMIKKALATIDELGYREATQRRMAVPTDVSVNNVLFADASVAPVMKDSLMDSLMTQVKPKMHNIDKVEEITIENFISDVLPNITSMEVLFEGGQVNNLMYLTAPAEGSKNMFKWDNNFGWGYNGDVTDSIKERVKAAGGNVSADVRYSLSWYNFDDLDLHLKEPDGNHIFHGNRRGHRTGANLDVDMNAGSSHTRTPVENICYPSLKNVPKGTQLLQVKNYTKRESIDVGFEIEIEINGEVTNYTFDKAVANKEVIDVARINHENGEFDIEVMKGVKSSTASQEVWGINTRDFHKVTMMTTSPNHWDDNESGNKHYFFVIEGCATDQAQRGLYNEFLKPELNDHRKVFEVLGSKTKCEPVADQLAGLGFSSTQRKSLTCKVMGDMNRTLQINF